MLHDLAAGPTAFRTTPADAAVDLYTDLLARQGYCIIPDAMSEAAVAELDADLADAFDETPFCQGGFYGGRTKRFGRLLARSERTAAFVQHAVILGVTERLLEPWCDTIQLNLTQAIALHPGALPQLPHRDQKKVLTPPRRSPRHFLRLTRMS